MSGFGKLEHVSSTLKSCNQADNNTNNQFWTALSGLRISEYPVPICLVGIPVFWSMQKFILEQKGNPPGCVRCFVTLRSVIRWLLEFYRYLGNESVATANFGLVRGRLPSFFQSLSLSFLLSLSSHLRITYWQRITRNKTAKTFLISSNSVEN